MHHHDALAIGRAKGAKMVDGPHVKELFRSRRTVSSCLYCLMTNSTCRELANPDCRGCMMVRVMGMY
jgi:hypothetical protein